MSAAPTTATNPAWTPLGKKIDLGREVVGTLPSGSGAVMSAYNLGTSTDGLGVLQGEDATSGIAFFRLSPGQGVTLSPSTDGNAIVITSSVLAGNTPGVMLQSVYDPSATGTVVRANSANSVPWSGVTGAPATYAPTLPIPESGVTNLTADLAGKVPTGRSVNTLDSLEGGGPLTADINIGLVNDTPNPGAEMRYGTDASGVRGWYPASTGAGDMSRSVYDTNNDGVVDMAQAVVAGGVTGPMLANGAITSSLGYNPVNKAGDTMTGTLTVLKNGPNVFPNMYQQAHLLAQVAPTGGGYPAIGLARQAPGGGAVAIWYNSGHQDLNLEYADGTAATLLSSISAIYGSQLVAASVPASALASGVAQTNLGYRPVNWNGDSMVNTNVFVWQREWGLGAASWQGAPIRVQCAGANARAQIAFWNMPTNAASLYLETDGTFRYIGNSGAVGILRDSMHPIGNADMVPTAALENLQNTNTAQAGLYVSGQIVLQKQLGIGANTLWQSPIRIQSTDGNGRACMGFVTPTRSGAALYWEPNWNAFWYVRNDGAAYRLLDTGRPSAAVTESLSLSGDKIQFRAPSGKVYTLLME